MTTRSAHVLDDRNEEWLHDDNATIFECRCCERYCRGFNDGSFVEPDWRRLSNIDGPNAICPDCVDEGEEALLMWRDEYPNVYICESIDDQ